MGKNFGVALLSRTGLKEPVRDWTASTACAAENKTF